MQLGAHLYGVGTVSNCRHVSADIRLLALSSAFQDGTRRCASFPPMDGRRRVPHLLGYTHPWLLNELLPDMKRADLEVGPHMKGIWKRSERRQYCGRSRDCASLLVCRSLLSK